MLFNFILQHKQYTPPPSRLSDDVRTILDVATVQADSKAEAIKIYILGDNPDTKHIIKLLLQIYSTSSSLRDNRTEAAASRLIGRLERIRGIGRINLDRINSEYDEGIYKQAIDDNFDTIVNFVSDISKRYPDVLKIQEINFVLTGPDPELEPRIKSAAKQ